MCSAGTCCARLVHPRCGGPRRRATRACRVAWGELQLLTHDRGHVGERFIPRDRGQSTHREPRGQPVEHSRDARGGRETRQRRMNSLCRAVGERRATFHTGLLCGRASPRVHGARTREGSYAQKSVQKSVTNKAVAIVGCMSGLQQKGSLTSHGGRRARSHLPRQPQ
mgnify:CR=1 FL=1